MGKQGSATLNRFQYSPVEGTQLMIVQRYYSYNYWAMFAHSFGEGSAVQNEQGYYLGGNFPFPLLAHPCFLRSVFFPVEEIPDQQTFPGYGRIASGYVYSAQ